MAREHDFNTLGALLNGMIGDVYSKPQFPPHDIVQTGDLTYEIIFALAGYSKDEIAVDFNEGKLIVSTVEKEKEEEDKPERKYTFLHKGIAKRAFKTSFKLSPDTHVVDASFVNGLLTINLERIIPDELKPRKIEIKGATPLEPEVKATAIEDNTKNTKSSTKKD